MSSASNDSKISLLEQRFGLVGYAVYFKLIELCASNWDEVSPPVFIFSRKKISLLIGLKSKQTELLMSYLSELNLFQIEIGEFAIKVFAPKLAEVKKRYEKKREATTTQPHSYIETEVETEVDIQSEITRTDFTHPLEIENETKLIKPSFDLESLYQAYPKKEGKKKGIEKFKSIINTQDKFEQVKKAIYNYSSLVIEKDSQYIKQFSSFSSVWEDYLEIQVSEKDSAINLLIAMQVQAESDYLLGVANA